MFNYVYLSVKAPCEFILSLARLEKIKLKSVKKAEDGCCFYVASKDLPLLIAILQKNNREYKIIKDFSVKTFISRNKVRYGLFVGLIMAVIVMVFYSINLTRIQIEGNNIVSEITIMQVVNKNVVLPEKKKNVDRKKIICDIVALEGISNAAVELKGNTIIISVYEELPKVEISDPNDYSDIVSKYDATVTRVVTYSGGAVVKSGQSVRKGDKLITADIVLEENLTAKEKPLGDIYGRVWFSKSLVITPTIWINKRTGNKEIYNQTVFGKKDKIKCGFENYEVEENTYLLQAIIPVKVTKITYYELKRVEISFDYDANKEGIIKENTYTLENTLPDGAVKRRTWYIEKRVDKNVYLDIYYEVEMKIS